LSFSWLSSPDEVYLLVSPCRPISTLPPAKKRSGNIMESAKDQFASLKASLTCERNMEFMVRTFSASLFMAAPHIELFLHSRLFIQM
jgi:hypothetical protein